jgi:hypothetical protein
MRIDSAKLFEGAKFTNLTVDSGASFPLAPDLGELFLNTTDSKLYYYNGSAWVTPNGGLGTQIHFGEDPPDEPTEFPLWWNTQYAALLLWYQDVDSGQWIETIGGNVVTSTIGDSVEVNPVSPSEGDIRVVGTVISIYADNAWRQIFPAIYS